MAECRIKDMKTDLNYIKKLIKLLDGSGVTELEIEEEGIKVRLAKNTMPEPQQVISYAPPVQGVIPQATLPLTAQSAEAAPAVTETKPEIKPPAVTSNVKEVRSPIVGTFYRAPSPNADPYVQVGQNVAKGTVLCIIEAMKLMNEIESEVEGRIVKILVENAQPVEYDQVLFLIEVI
jgi:acetyl-CoA carboxylase biotin carboxyl carrier protein